MTRHLGVGVVLLTAACATQSTRVPAPSGVFEDQQVRAVLREALEADAAGRPADSLYLVSSTVVLDGRTMLSRPRFAAVGNGGQVNVTRLAVEITQGFAWATLDYRWTSGDGRVTEPARATVVLERLGGAWRIKHLHSSSLRP